MDEGGREELRERVSVPIRDVAGVVTIGSRRGQDLLGSPLEERSCDVMPLGAMSQGLLPTEEESRGSSLPHLGESDLPHFHLEQDLILYLSLGVKNDSLSGQQIGRCISEEKTQLQRPESQGR